MVEFAIGLVFVMILLAGIVDVGRALFTLMALREAAQEGAVYGATISTNETAIEERVFNTSDLLKNLKDAGSANLVVNTTISGDACTGGLIHVQISYSNFPITMPFLGALIGRQHFPLSAEATDTILRPPCP